MGGGVLPRGFGSLNYNVKTNTRGVPKRAVSQKGPGNTKAYEGTDRK